MHGGEGIKFSALLGYIFWYIKGFFTLKMIVARYLSRYILFQVWIIIAKFDVGRDCPVCGVSCRTRARMPINWCGMLLKKLNMDGTTHQPERVVIDFEDAAKPHSGSACGQLQFSFLKRKSYRTWDSSLFFNQDQDFQEWIRMIYALSYVPK
jgi:hypothetical protein